MPINQGTRIQQAQKSAAFPLTRVIQNAGFSYSILAYIHYERWPEYYQFFLFYASVPREAINKQTKNTPAYASSEKETLRKMQSKDRRRYLPVLGHHTSLQACKNDYFIFALADKINEVSALIVCHFRGPNSSNLFFLSRK